MNFKNWLLKHEVSSQGGMVDVAPMPHVGAFPTYEMPKTKPLKKAKEQKPNRPTCP